MQTDTRQGLQNPDFLGINANLKCYVSHTLSVIRIRSITIKFVNRVRGQSMISPRSYVLINKPQRDVSHYLSAASQRWNVADFAKRAKWLIITAVSFGLTTYSLTHSPRNSVG